jgi:hypothetical protein
MLSATYPQLSIGKFIGTGSEKTGKIIILKQWALKVGKKRILSHFHKKINETTTCCGSLVL